MKKTIIASCYSLTALAMALWLVLFTIFNDIMRSPFGEGVLIWELKLFGPMMIFLFCCYRYVRIRRSMDKEKMSSPSQSAVVEEFLRMQTNELCGQAVLDLLPEGKLTEKTVGPELVAVLNELRFAYHSGLKQGVRMHKMSLSVCNLLDRLEADMEPVDFSKRA